MSPPGENPACLLVRDVSRSFGHTQALAGCSLELRSGEVHAIAGENGSGKSTLVKVLSGALMADGGTIALDGEETRGFSSPAEAQGLGIATVFQETLVIETLNVLENVWLGMDGDLLRHRVAAETRRAEAAKVLDGLLGRSLDLGADVGSLDLSVRQAIVVARALVRRPRVLILDESTSALDVELRDRLLATVRELRDKGVAIVFITHRMDEVEAVADRVTVLRSGRDAGTLAGSEIETGRIVELMSPTRGGPLARRESRPRGPALTAREVELRAGTKPVTVTLRAGEILGLAGLEGHGQDQFLRVLAGLERPPAGRVERHLDDGSTAVLRSARKAFENGVVYVPRERKADGLFESLSILDNFSLATIDRDLRLGLVSEARRRRRLEGFRERLGIRFGRATDPISGLSGGNQQKVLMSRWLAAGPAVCALNDPTRGVDLATKRDIYGLLAELADQGVAIVMVSTEVEEHLALMDRVLVFREGQVFCELGGESLDPQALVAAMFGRVAEPVA